MEKDKLIEYMRKAVACHNENPADCLGRYCCDCSHDYPAETIELIESALELLEQDRWIPIAERMPEENDFVLVTVSGEDVRGCAWKDSMALAVWTNQWNLVDANLVSYTISAWRPLPEPYTEEES